MISKHASVGKLKEMCKEVGMNSTSHGIPNILKAKTYSLKIIWLICFLLSCAVCSFLIFKAISNYFSFETVSKFTIINETPAEFPTITICNKNLIKKANVENILKNILKNISLVPRNDTVIQIEDLLKSFIFNLSNEEKKIFGLELKELIQVCIFNNYICDIENDFVWEYNYFYGNCYKFNTGKNQMGNPVPKKYINLNAKYGGLFLVANVGESLLETFGKGLHIMIHNSTIKPSTGIDISAGTETSVAIKRTFINKQEKPYSDCILDIQNYNSGLKNIIIKSGYKYRQSDCFLLIFQKYIINKVGCFYPMFDPLDCKKQCLSLNDHINFQETIREFFEFNMYKKFDLSECPLECDTINYDYSISFANLPQKNFSNSIIRSNKTTESYIENMVILNVYYDSLLYSSIDETPKMDWFDLVSNIGGTLGLFTGISLLSFCEIIELAYVIIQSYRRMPTKVVHNGK